jgi:hypothetical protein
MHGALVGASASCIPCIGGDVGQPATVARYQSSGAALPVHRIPQDNGRLKAKNMALIATIKVLEGQLTPKKQLLPRYGAVNERVRPRGGG